MRSATERSGSPGARRCRSGSCGCPAAAHRAPLPYSSRPTCSACRRHVPTRTETSGLGAAIDAAVGLGIHPDFEAAVGAMTRVLEAREHDPRAHELYEASGLGAAVDAAVGLGMHRDFESAIAAMTRSGRRFEPNEAARATYERLYSDVYLKMYRQLRPLYERIGAIVRRAP